MGTYMLSSCAHVQLGYVVAASRSNLHFDLERLRQLRTLPRPRSLLS